MQSYSWVWPLETEQENPADRARLNAMLAELIRQAGDAEEIGHEVDPDEAAAAIFAIYTWALRGVVFEDQTPAECHAAMMAQIRSLLGLPQE